MLHRHLACAVVDLENEVHRMGLHTITRLTLIARDPANPAMSVCITNDALDETMDTLRYLQETGTVTKAPQGKG